jgi:hypothetical protein
MTRLRLWVSISFLWLTLLFNIERLYEPFNIASFVYVYAAVLGVLALTVPPLMRLHRIWTVLIATTAFVGVKALLGYPVAGRGLPLTVTEAVAIAITAMLARQIVLSIMQFEESVFEVAALHWVQRPLDFKEMQHEFYREVRRARQYDRPVSLVALKPVNADLPRRASRLINEVNKRMTRYYMEAQIADVIASRLHDCELVAKCNDEFLVMLPEADSQRAQHMADQLATELRETLGTAFRTGIAAFPHEETTFSGLLERAEAALRKVPRQRNAPQEYGDGRAAECVLTT